MSCEGREGREGLWKSEGHGDGHDRRRQRSKHDKRISGKKTEFADNRAVLVRGNNLF